MFWHILRADSLTYSHIDVFTYEVIFYINIFLFWYLCASIERLLTLRGVFSFPVLGADEDTSGDDGVEQGALFENGARSHGRGGRGEEAEDDTASGNRPAQENHCNCLIHIEQTNKQTGKQNRQTNILT